MVGIGTASTLLITGSSAHANEVASELYVASSTEPGGGGFAPEISSGCQLFGRKN